MASDIMYQLAFRFRERKMWKTLSDTDLFAVRFSDGEIGYCCVMGMLGEHFALAVYPGQDGYASYCYTMDYATDHDVPDTELIVSQNCIQCSFENKAMLAEREVEDVQRYAAETGRTLRGRNAFPQFVKYSPGRYPWHFDCRQDEDRICEALEAAIWLSDLLKEKKIDEAGMRTLYGESRDLLLLKKTDGTWKLSSTTRPAGERVWPVPVLENEVITAHLRKAKKTEKWECGTIYLPSPVQNEEDDMEIPWFPLTLLCVDSITGMVKSPIMGKPDEQEEMLRELAEMMVSDNICPQTIYAADDRCFALLENFCSRCGIRLIRQDGLDEYEMARDSLLEHVNGDEPDYEEDEDESSDGEAELDQFFDTLMKMRDEELQTMPEDFVRLVFNLAENGLVPEELIQRMKKLF